MDIFHHFVFDLIAKRFLDQSLKGFLLCPGRQRHGTAKNVFYEFAMCFLWILGIEERRVNIGCTVVEAREEKAGFGHFYHPVTDTVVEFIVDAVIA